MDHYTYAFEAGLDLDQPWWRVVDLPMGQSTGRLRAQSRHVYSYGDATYKIDKPKAGTRYVVVGIGSLADPAGP